jgi:hypothetical protein
LADGRLPVSHWAARLTILFVLAVLVFTAGVSGAAVDVGRRAYDCGSRATLALWAPLLEPEAPAPPRPISGCLHRDG